MRQALVAMLLLLVLSLLYGEAKAAGTSLHKLPIKTIQSEDGDIVDCVDLYDQPSLRNLPVENRSLHMLPSRPSPFASLNASKNLQRVQQRWRKSGSCPQGTIPLRRNTLVRDQKNGFGPRGAVVERALAYATRGRPFFGATADLQVWQLQVEPNEYSMSHVTVMSAENPTARSFADLEITYFVRAGWMVNPMLYGDDLPRIFVQWSTDNGVETGCFNLECEGFVLVSPDIGLGYSCEPLSVYGDPEHQYSLTVTIYLDTSQQRWYVGFNEEVLGYFPLDSLFDDFREARVVAWGGQILNTWPNGLHTTTQMGSGHLAQEGRGRAAVDSMLGVFKDDQLAYGYKPSYFRDRPGCYDTAAYAPDPKIDNYFTYGGPGGHTC